MRGPFSLRHQRQDTPPEPAEPGTPIALSLNELQPDHMASGRAVASLQCECRPHNFYVRADSPNERREGRQAAGPRTLQPPVQLVRGPPTQRLLEREYQVTAHHQRRTGRTNFYTTAPSALGRPPCKPRSIPSAPAPQPIPLPAHPPQNARRRRNARTSVRCLVRLSSARGFIRVVWLVCPAPRGP